MKQLINSLDVTCDCLDTLRDDLKSFLKKNDINHDWNTDNLSASELIQATSLVISILKVGYQSEEDA